MLFKDGRLGCFGNNDNGQLGIDVKKYSDMKSMADDSDNEQEEKIELPAVEDFSGDVFEEDL